MGEASARPMKVAMATMWKRILKGWRDWWFEWDNVYDRSTMWKVFLSVDVGGIPLIYIFLTVVYRSVNNFAEYHTCHRNPMCQQRFRPHDSCRLMCISFNLAYVAVTRVDLWSRKRQEWSPRGMSFLSQTFHISVSCLPFHLGALQCHLIKCTAM
jgi:hypothetical protein